jgi:hypothetical protein
VTEIPRVELPSLVAQSEHVARVGGGRSVAADVVQRNEVAYRLELTSRRLAEEVQHAEEIPAVRERPRDEQPPDRRRRHGRPDGAPPNDDEDGDEIAHVDVVA